MTYVGRKGCVPGRQKSARALVRALVSRQLWKTKPREGGKLRDYWCVEPEYGDSDESSLARNDRNLRTKSMTMAYVVLVHLLLICPLIRSLSIWMQAGSQRPPRAVNAASRFYAGVSRER